MLVSSLHHSQITVVFEFVVLYMILFPVLKESLHCTTCDVYVNSENQMKQHINSLRHKNTLQGIPTPPKPGREEKPKVKSVNTGFCFLVSNIEKVVLPILRKL